jgi:hypothetical protein
MKQIIYEMHTLDLDTSGVLVVLGFGLVRVDDGREQTDPANLHANLYFSVSLGLIMEVLRQQLICKLKYKG